MDSWIICMIWFSEYLVSAMNSFN